MASRELWDRYRAWLYDDPQLGISLDVSRADLPTDYLKTMEKRMAGTFDAMDDLENGGIANADENRMVGHYWLRAPHLAPSAEIGGQIRQVIEDIRTFSEAVHGGRIQPVHADRFTRFLLVGIGGSALGPQFLADALGDRQGRMKPFFLDNTDPEGIDRVLDRLGGSLADTLVIIVSKSGGTPETRNGMLEAAAAYRRAGLQFGRHAVAVTRPGSDLDKTASEQSFLARFPMWDWIGGRTSVMSAVGLLPAALQGIEIQDLLDGAAAMDRVTRGRLLLKNPAALLALCWYHLGEGRGSRAMVILPYKDRLSLFGKYLQQLIMESLGKKLDLDGNKVYQGLTVYGNKGSTDQHAYVQQLRDGPPNFFVTFVEVLRDRKQPSLEVEPETTSGDFLHGFLLGTRQALCESGRPSLTLTLRQIDAQSIGMLIALYERAVGLYATLININPYHQPGVEAGKQAAASILELQRLVLAAVRSRAEGGTCEDLADQIDAPDRVEEVYRILEHLAANPGRGITRTAGKSTFTAVYRYNMT